jgi:hypothetical protein
MITLDAVVGSVIRFALVDSAVLTDANIKRQTGSAQK